MRSGRRRACRCRSPRADHRLSARAAAAAGRRQTSATRLGELGAVSAHGRAWSPRSSSRSPPIRCPRSRPTRAPAASLAREPPPAADRSEPPVAEPIAAAGRPTPPERPTRERAPRAEGLHRPGSALGGRRAGDGRPVSRTGGASPARLSPRGRRRRGGDRPDRDQRRQLEQATRRTRRAQPTTTPATTATGGTTTTGRPGRPPASAKVIAQVNLTTYADQPRRRRPRNRRGAPESEASTGSRSRAEHAAPNTKHNAYAVWLYNSPAATPSCSDS